MFDALSYLVNEGAVTESCMPYVEPDKHPACPNNRPNKYCKDGSEWTKYYCKDDSIKRFKSIEDIKLELYKNGPLSARIDKYSDLINYKSGIYSHTALA
jgi:cathepsin B